MRVRAYAYLRVRVGCVCVHCVLICIRICMHVTTAVNLFLRLLGSEVSSGLGLSQRIVLSHNKLCL